MGDIRQSMLDSFRSRDVKSKLKERKTSTTLKTWVRKEWIRIAGCCQCHILCLKQIPELDVEFLSVCFRTWASLHKSVCIKRDSIHLDIKSGWRRSWLDTSDKCWGWAGVNQGKLSINKCHSTCVLWLFLCWNAFEFTVRTLKPWKLEIFRTIFIVTVKVESKLR